MSDSTTVKRGVSLSAKTNADLLELCEALGVNPHSYMVNEIAKSVQRDSITLITKKANESALEMVLKALQDSE